MLNLGKEERVLIHERRAAFCTVLRIVWFDLVAFRKAGCPYSSLLFINNL